MGKIAKPVGRPPKDEARLPLTPLQKILSDNMVRLLGGATQADTAKPRRGKGKGAAQSTISRWKNGSVNPNVKTLEGLAGAHGFPAWMLLYPGFNPDDPPMPISTGGLNKALASAGRYGDTDDDAEDQIGGPDRRDPDRPSPRISPARRGKGPKAAQE